MAKYKFTSSLSVKGLRGLIADIEQYKQQYQEKKMIFIERLADFGITVAEASAKGDSHHFDSMVVFEKKKDGNTIYIIGRNADLSQLHTEWYDSKGQYHQNVISPIAMLEFGSAGMAIKGFKGSYAVTGTSVNKKVWMYATELDEKGEPTGWEWASAEEPHEPMHKAFLEMQSQIFIVAREVFG